MIKRLIVVLLIPIISSCVGMNPRIREDHIVKPVKEITLTWLPAKHYFADTDDLLYGLTRHEYEKLVEFLNDANRYINTYKIDDSYKRLEDVDKYRDELKF